MPETVGSEGVVKAIIFRDGVQYLEVAVPALWDVAVLWWTWDAVRRWTERARSASLRA